MKYIYILIEDKKPFYVGKATSVVKRIKWHYSCIDSFRTFVKLNTMLKDDKYPEVFILGLFDEKIATELEKNLIKGYCSVYELTNSTYNVNATPLPSYKFKKTKRPSKEFYNQLKQIESLWQTKK